ncbi:MAG: hypothetical protein CW341_10865, partial [Bacteroidetes bacterium]|nr:hypothetical protein [Bacteroidota bacterium]
MRKGLTPNIEAIIDNVAQLECIKPYTLCGGTALAIQIGHRMSEDLDFMMWRISKTEKPEVDWPTIEKEIEEKVGKIEHRDILGFDQVAFVVKGVKLSFFVSNNFSPLNERIPYQGNIFLTSSLRTPEVIVKEFFNGFVTFHDHCSGEYLSVERQSNLYS